MSLDFLGLEEALSIEQQQIKKSIRRFVSEEYLPHVANYYENSEFPSELPVRLAELGALGANIQGYSCPGLGNFEYGLIMRELERGDSGLRSFASVQSSLAMYAVYAFGSEDQKSEWLPQMASAKVIGCFGLTEPDFGSNPGGMLSTAKKTDRGYVLQGTKRWITNGGISQRAVIWAKLDGRVQGFFIPTDAPGLVVKNIPNKLSLRASVTSEIVMDSCEVSESCLLPEAKGLRSALSCLNQARFGIVWGALGAAEACYQEALDYSKARESFGMPLAQKQMVQDKLVWMLSEITKGQTLAWRLTELKDSGKILPAQISLGKMNNVGMALEVARKARDILGASGVSLEYSSMRHMCNLESVNTYEGAFDVHKLVLGETITGLNAF